MWASCCNCDCHKTEVATYTVTNYYPEPTPEPFPYKWEIPDNKGRRSWQRQQAKDAFLRAKGPVIYKSKRTKRARKQRSPFIRKR